jgi:hypothetical protein
VQVNSTLGVATDEIVNDTRVGVTSKPSVGAEYGVWHMNRSWNSAS